MAVKKRRGRPRKSASTTAKKTGAKRGRPRKATATAPKKSTATSTAKKKTARKLKVGDCSGKLTRSRLVGGYALKKRVRKPKAVRRGRPPRRR